MTLALQRPPAGKIKTDESGRLYMVSDPTPDTPNIHLWDTGGKYKVEGVNFDDEATSVTIEPSGKINASAKPSGASSFDAITGSLILGTNAGGASTRSFSAGKFAINVFSDNDVGNLYGLSGTAVKQGDGDVNKMYGLYFLGRAYSGGKTGILKGAHIETNLFNGAESDELYGVHSYVNLTGATAKKIAGVYSQLAMLNTSGIEEYYGLLIEQTDVAASVRIESNLLFIQRAKHFQRIDGSWPRHQKQRPGSRLAYSKHSGQQRATNRRRIDRNSNQTAGLFRR
jgi:hypothetical protein